MKIQFKTWAIRTGLFLIATTFLVACGNTDNNNEVNTVDEHTTNQDAVQTQNTQATDVTFRDKSGKAVSISSLKGKVVFINFWATWCPPCIQEMPTINKLRQTYKGKDIVFLMVDVDSEINKSSAFMEQNKYDLPVYIPASNIPSSFLGQAIPTTVILNKSGDMIARMEGGRDYSNPEIIKALDELIESN